MSEVTAPSRLRIQVPMDFSEAARLALRTALRLAQPPEDVVHVFETPGLNTKTSEDAASGQSVWQQRGSWRKRFLAWTESEGSGVVVEMLPHMGKADATVIAEMAIRMESTLIMLSRRKCTFWQRLSGGCLSEELSRVAPCPAHFVHAPSEFR